MSAYKRDIECTVTNLVEYIRSNKSSELITRIPPDKVAKAVLVKSHLDGVYEVTKKELVEIVNRYLRSKASDSFIEGLKCQVLPNNRDFSIIVKKIDKLPESRDRRNMRSHFSSEFDYSGINAADDDDNSSVAVMTDIDSTPNKKSEEMVRKRLVQPIKKKINEDMNKTFNLFKKLPKLRTSETDMRAHVEKVLTDPEVKQSLRSVPAYAIYLSPIDDQKTNLMRENNETLYDVLSSSITSLNKQDDASAEFAEENDRETVNIMSLMFHNRSSGQMQTPPMQKHVLSTSSMTFSERGQSSADGWSPSQFTATKLNDACLQSMVTCSKLALEIAPKLGYVITCFIDNHNRFMYQSSLQTGLKFTTVFCTQAVAFSVLPPGCVDPDFIANSDQETNQEFMPVRTWRTEEESMQYIHDHGYLLFLEEFTKQYPTRCIRPDPDPRMKDLIPIPSLGGRSASYEEFVTNTLPVLVPEDSHWRIRVVDPEYIIHEAKALAAHSILPTDEKLTAICKKLNKSGTILPPFHASLHMTRIAVKNKSNFYLFVQPLLNAVFPTFKKNFMQLINKNETATGNRRTRELDNDLDEQSAEEENEEDGSESKTPAKGKKSKKKRSISETVIANDDNEEVKFYMSFQRCYVLLEIVLMMYDELKHELHFSGKHSAFYESFFNFELRLVVQGLSDWREGNASTMLANWPVITHYLAMTGHPKLVNCCLFLQNNLDYWKARHPEIIRTICLNCDYFSDERIELVNGGVATQGHLNRKDPDDAFLDPVRMFATACEKFDGLKGEGEILHRTKIKNSKRMVETKREVGAFLRNLAAGKVEVPNIVASPFADRIEASRELMLQYIADYTRHYTCSMFSKTITAFRCSKDEAILKKIIFYRPVFKIVVDALKDAKSPLKALVLRSCLENDTLDWPVFLHILKHSKHFRKDSKRVPSKQLLDFDRYPRLF